MAPLWLRRLVGVLSSIGGSALVFGLVLAMNALDRGPKEPPAKAAATFDVVQKRKPPPTRRKPPPKPKPKPSETPPPPTPALASAIGGLDLGLWGGGAVDLSEGADALLGEARDVVMTADAVDDLPALASSNPAPYPPSARSKGITGVVTVSVLIDAQGRVGDARILDSQPPGVFDAAALQTVQSARFQPARYQGQPVAVRIDWPVRFDLER